MENRIHKVLSNILLIFLIIQPMFDIYMGVVGENLDIFGISLVTLIRTTTTVTLLITIAIYQIKNKYKIKWLYALLGYLLFVGIYAVLHHFNIVLSEGYFITQGIYNFMTELMYVLRLLVPILLIYVVMIIAPENKKIEKAIVISMFIIAMIIIITNIFKISYASYSPVNDSVEYNIFEWFTNDELPYKKTLSKGFFVSANQIGALLVVLLPIVILQAIKHNKLTTYFVLFFGIISMVLVGTRVASLGFILVTLTMLIGFIIIALIRKSKLQYIRLIAIFVIMLVGVVIYSKSPAHSRTFLADDEGLYAETIQDEINVDEYITLDKFKEILQDESKIKEYMGYSSKRNIDLKELQYRAMCKYIKENYKYHAITKKYIMNIYPYTEDPEFWLELFEQPVSVKGDNRSRQSVVIKRIKELNGNYLFDTLVGMGATPMNPREYMIENDLISHYYNIGVIGIALFVAPYAIVVLYAIIKVLKNIKYKLTSRIAAYCLSIFMTYAVGYCAGHVIDEYIITIYVATITALLINEFTKEGVKRDEYTKA